MSRLSLNYYMDKRKVAGWLERKICHRFLDFKAFIGNVKSNTKAIDTRRMSADKVKLLYNGIDTQEFAKRKTKDKFHHP